MGVNSSCAEVPVIVLLVQCEQALILALHKSHLQFQSVIPIPLCVDMELN